MVVEKGGALGRFDCEFSRLGAKRTLVDRWGLQQKDTFRMFPGRTLRDLVDLQPFSQARDWPR